MVGCDAHFNADGEAVCSCTEAERFNSSPDDSCEYCTKDATRTLKMIPSGRGQVCEACYVRIMSEPLDPDAKYSAAK